MKTIREIFADSRVPEDEIVAALESREEERDAAERERVASVIHKELHSESERKRFIDAVYPPPEPEKLKGGRYWYYRQKLPGGHWTLGCFKCDFLPRDDFEYRRCDIIEGQDS